MHVIRNWLQFNRTLFTIVSVAVSAILLAFTASRQVILYKLLPPALIAVLIIFLYRRFLSIRKHTTLILVIFVSLTAIIHLLIFRVIPGGDSVEYIRLGNVFAETGQLGGEVYRAPLYPFLVGIAFTAASESAGSFLLIAFQHLLYIICVTGTFIIAKKLGFRPETALTAAVIMATNSFVLQSASWIMSEMLFMTLILLCILVFIKLNESPTLLWAITSGITCSAASHCRQLALPFFLAALAILIFRTRKRGAVLSAVAILTLLLCNMPWSLRNLNLHGSYTISSHLGPNIFTKLTSYRLENAKGRWYGKIEPVYSNVLKDLGLSGYKAPDHPEEAWQVNRIPHALSDSLKKYHGYTYPQAGNLMLKVSLEGFVSKPADYIRSIGKTMYVLVFQHMELYPFPNHAFPLPKAAYNILFFRQVATGASHISGLFIVMFPLVFFLRHKNSILLIIPFTILLIGYLTTAAVHVGFTRYTIPWIPYSVICAAYVLEFLFLNFFTDTQKRKV